MALAEKLHLLGPLHDGYSHNKAPELSGTLPYSDRFFSDLPVGFLAAYRGLLQYILTANHLEKENLSLPERAFWNLYAIGVLGASTVFATGLTTYVQTIKELQKERNTLGEKVALGVYGACLGVFFTAKNIDDDEETYGIQNRDGKLYKVPSGGYMKEKDLKKGAGLVVTDREPW